MKNRGFLPALLLAVILPLVILVAQPASPALAASVTISPDNGNVDSLVHISGTGFTSSVTYRVYFAYDTNYETVGIGLVAGDGTISQFFSVPELPNGTYEVRVETSYEHVSDYFDVEAGIELSETTLLVGEQLSVYGTGFRASRSITIKFDEQVITTGATDSKGSFTETFRVPDSERGSHEVTAYDNTNRVSARLSVEQSISISPDKGPVGTSVTVNGTGFRDEEYIIISFDDEEIDTIPSSVTTDENGSFTAAFDVPTCLNRAPEVRASDGRYVATDEFTILAEITLSPTSGSYGDTVTVTGSGFRSNRRISVDFDGGDITTMPSSVHSDDTGCFEFEFEVPESTYSTHEIEADDGIYSDDADFTTLSSVRLSPTSGPIGADVTVNGTGFGANKVITIRFADNHVRTSATDTAGSFTDHFVVPQNRSGSYHVSADDGTVSGTAVFTITTSVELNPNTGHVGTVITVVGTGFADAVTVRYDDAVFATTNADANGSLTISFPAPASVSGHHMVTVSDSVNTIETTFTMESEPPPVPGLLMPENGARQNSRPSFDWETVTDPSGVTYTLQIATDDSFNTLLLEKPGLTQSQYTLAREEGLNSTDREAPYHWRVRAVDGAFNESNWSTSRSFFVSFVPQWAIYGSIAVVSVAASVLITRKVWGKGSRKQ